MKRFEFTIDVPDAFEIDDESMDNIKSYLYYCFKVNNIIVNRWDLPEWFAELREQCNNADQEVPF